MYSSSVNISRRRSFSLQVNSLFMTQYMRIRLLRSRKPQQVSEVSVWRMETATFWYAMGYSSLYLRPNWISFIAFSCHGLIPFSRVAEAEPISDHDSGALVNVSRQLAGLPETLETRCPKHTQHIRTCARKHRAPPTASVRNWESICFFSIRRPLKEVKS